MKNTMVYTKCIHGETFRSYDKAMKPTDKKWEDMTYANRKALLELYEPLYDLIKKCTQLCPRNNYSNDNPW